MNRWIGVAALIAGVLSAAGAHADPRLDEKVYDPYVHNGMAELEVREAGEVGHGVLSGAATTAWEAEYGLNDRVSLALVGTITHDGGGATRMTAIGFEAVGYLEQVPRLGIDTGIYLEATRGLNGESDGFEGKLLFAKTAGRFQGLLNLIVEKPISAPAGEGFAAYGYAASATWRVVGHWRLGAEAFGDLGDDHVFLKNQGAYIGPQIKWNGRPKGSPVEIELDGGWLAPIGANRAEAGSQLRLGVELERRF